MNAKKCDRCGVFYVQNVEYFGKLKGITKCKAIIDDCKTDLCADCRKSLSEWWEDRR